MQYSIGELQTTFGKVQYSIGEVQITFGKMQYSIGELQTTFGKVQYSIGEVQKVFGLIQCSYGKVQTVIGEDRKGACNTCYLEVKQIFQFRNYHLQPFPGKNINHKEACVYRKIIYSKFLRDLCVTN